jgi:thiamine biosynthesis protein ThiI
MRGTMKLAALISGGIDSPVAAHMLLSKGAELVAVHFDNRPFTDEKQIEKAKMLVHKLEELSERKIKLYLVPHGNALLEISKNTTRRFGCVICRRMMLRTAERIARRENADALLTGESLGQVASQTLRNIAAEEAAVEIPIIRPLIGLDKIEIERVAKEIGTYDTSIMPGSCCTFVPDKPATQARLESILEEESKIDIDELTRNAEKGAELVE